MNMKRFSASPGSSEVWASHQEEKPSKRKHIYSKEFQEMLDKLDHEELGEDDPEEEGLLGFGGGEKKRRLGVDQVKALERSFEKDDKLEPERKNRLAVELGLQPRQVAIWFQNRRARGKSKQLERDYGVLKSDYDSLRAGYDYLCQEKKSLLSQLTELKMKLKQQVRVAGNDLDLDRLVGSEEECPVSESVVVLKTQLGYSSEIDASSNSDDCSDALVEKEILEEEEPNHNNKSTVSSGSSCTTSMLSWFQGWDSRGPTLGAAGKAAYLHTYPRVVADEPQYGWLNFFSVDHAPTLHCYFAEDGREVAWPSSRSEQSCKDYDLGDGEECGGGRQNFKF